MADLQAVLKTNRGDITVNLLPNHAPETVDNFVGLAEGTKDYDAGNGRSGPFYDGLGFHRVISGFMIQGGCPLGTGTGGPGYTFKDEPHPELTFDKPYLLAMANAGPGTNGSQFFITVGATPWLNFKHTIFGEVADQASRDVVDAIETTPTGPGRQARRARGHRARRDQPRLAHTPTEAHRSPPETRRDGARCPTQPRRVRRAPSRPVTGTRAARPTSAASAARRSSVPTACGTRRSASSAPTASRRGPRTTRSARTAYGGLRPTNAGITSMVIIGVNVLVWLAILVSQAAGRLYGWLALLPTSQCLSESQTGAYYPVGVRGAVPDRDPSAR